MISIEQLRDMWQISPDDLADVDVMRLSDRDKRCLTNGLFPGHFLYESQYKSGTLSNSLKPIYSVVASNLGNLFKACFLAPSYVRIATNQTAIVECSIREIWGF